MRKKFLIYLILFIAFSIYAQKFSIDGSYFPDLYTGLDDFFIKDSFIVYKIEQTEEKRNVKYKEIHKDGMLFFQLNEKFSLDITEEHLYYGKTVDTSNTLLVLAGKEFYKDFYGAEKEKILFFGETAGFEEYDCFVTSSLHFYDHVGREYYDCTSCLKEKNKDYEVENLDDCMAAPCTCGAQRKL